MTKTIFMTLSLAVFGALGVAACSSGVGPETRTDIQAQMRTAEGPIQSCYQRELAANRRIQGTLSLRLTAEGGTGQFKNITVLRDEPRSNEVTQCVIAEISKLKLAKPPKSSVQIDQPIRFGFTNE